MITPELARRSRELADARQPFVTATVVRVQRPTSVLPGSVAIVLGDGTIEGFVGGACAEQSVKAYSLTAIESGEPVLLRILPEGVEAPEEDGAIAVTNPCLSGGAVEIFLEPTRPAPRVLIVGETPAAGALERIGEEAGFEMVRTDGHEPEPAAADFGLVVAAHGRDELHALRRGLEVRLPYVGLVASDKRAAGVLDELRSDGVEEELIDRIDVPAGIPIGSHTAGEIGLSILAGIISVRRNANELQGGQTPSRDAHASAPALAVDPICKMTVAAVPSTLSVERDGETVYFCSEGCKAKFEAEGEHASIAR